MMLLGPDVFITNFKCFRAFPSDKKVWTVETRKTKIAVGEIRQINSQWVFKGYTNIFSSLELLDLAAAVNKIEKINTNKVT